jgi:2-polyprenyl-6-methoxyphenol hydroxylase-like FAD-dependent oxidoreductase
MTAEDDGWTWIAEIGPRTFHWTRMSFADADRARQPPACLASLRQTDRVRAADVTWRRVKVPADRGYFIVGDAAVVLDPAASHGVLRALMSGMMAVHIATQVLAGVLDEDFAAQRYCDWMASWYQHDVDHLTGLYSQLNVPPAWLQTSDAPGQT